jgi:hypothetical protein
MQLRIRLKSRSTISPPHHPRCAGHPPGLIGVTCLITVNVVQRQSACHNAKILRPSLPLGGALASASWRPAASSSEPPTSVGLACRQVGAYRRHLVKRLQFMRGHRRRVRHCPGDRKDRKLAELGEGPRTAAGRKLGCRIPPQRTSERADSGSCSAAVGGRGQAGHPAQDPRCPPGHHRHGAIRAAHRGARAGGGH